MNLVSAGSTPSTPSRASRVTRRRQAVPFDAERDGFVPAEGAGILILESLEHALDRGANILAEIIGQGVSSDAFHAVQPDDNGDGAARAIRLRAQRRRNHGGRG